MENSLSLSLSSVLSHTQTKGERGGVSTHGDRALLKSNVYMQVTNTPSVSTNMGGRVGGILMALTIHTDNSCLFKESGKHTQMHWITSIHTSTSTGENMHRISFIQLHTMVLLFLILDICNFMIILSFLP